MVIYIKTLKSNLSNESLDEIINKLKSLKSELKETDKKIVDDMSEFVKKEVSRNLAATPYKDGNEDAEPYISKKGNNTKVGMHGTQVLYDEFGTGSKGQESPHPEKSKFGLNPYNSGKTIKINKKGELFWIYKNKSGELVKTNGIPAGKQVYNANIMLRGRKYQIIKKRVGEVISKL